MIKCKNCGSTGQIKLIETREMVDTIRETFECGCGCKIQRHLKIEKVVWRTKTGTLIATENNF